MELDEGFLREVGLAAMPEAQRQAFLEYAQEELEVRVGEVIAEGMTEEKMQEFEAAQTDEETEKWLNENKPNYKEMVEKTIEELKEEISRNKEKILA
ncbi:hypothetical protein IKL45_01600 [Candidatus Saccharibacteria bacterium]|nr:hypothetical protein [Candidatus Saccharibacteria bacterium]MBR6122270.1 hypothetical protein [Candidatus Saccharibacteria bacterium]